MIAFIGNLLLWAAIICCILSIVYSRIYSKNPIRSVRYTSLFGVSQFLIIFFSYILLTYAFIISDFSILTVWKNTDQNLVSTVSNGIFSSAQYFKLLEAGRRAANETLAFVALSYDSACKTRRAQ